MWIDINCRVRTAIHLLHKGPPTQNNKGLCKDGGGKGVSIIGLSQQKGHSFIHKGSSNLSKPRFNHISNLSVGLASGISSPGYSYVYTLSPFHSILFENKPLLSSYSYTRCDNLIPGMAATCLRDVESGKLMYPSTFVHVPTCVYMRHRPNEPFVPKQQRKQYVSVVYCWRKND
jgi:hypothetical protein